MRSWRFQVVVPEDELVLAHWDCAWGHPRLICESMATAYRADYTESFLRSAELLEACQSASAEHLRSVKNQQILGILSKQKKLGFEIATDGEFRRRNFMNDFTDAIDAVDLIEAVGRNWTADQSAAVPVSGVTGIVDIIFGTFERPKWGEFPPTGLASQSTPPHSVLASQLGPLFAVGGLLRPVWRGTLRPRRPSG